MASPFPVSPLPASPLPTLVAHRGDAQRFPENTLPALRAALEVGAEWIEFDVQVAADGVPVLMHDDDLRRTSGRAGRVHELTRQELDAVDVGEPARFGDAFAGTRLPALADVVALLREWTDRRAFVELKRASLRHFGRVHVLERVMAVLAPVADRCIIVSFDAPVLERARSNGAAGVGWVVEAWDDATRDAARTLAPEFLFVNLRRLPPAPAPLWPGPWRWVVYEITSVEEARGFADRGAAMVETMAIDAMMRVARDGAGP